MRDGLVWQSAPDGSVRRSGGPNAQHFCAGKNFPNAREYGVWRFSEPCTRVGNFSGMQRLYRHNTVRAGQPSRMSRGPLSQPMADKLSLYLDRYPATSLLVMRAGRLVFERYQYSGVPSDRFASFSMTKSVVAILVGIALDEGRIGSLDDLAEQYLPALSGTVWGRVSIRNLLRMSSGIAWRRTEDTNLHERDILVRKMPIAASLKRFDRLNFEAGRKFNYNNANTSVLGLVVARVFGAPLADVLSKRIWRPMGAERDAYWMTDVAQRETGFAYLNASPRDLIRLGQLLLAFGKLDDRQIIPARWVAQLAGEGITGCPFAPGCIFGKWGYAYQTWLLPDRLGYFFWGVYGQLLIILPKSQTVILQTGIADKPTFREEFLDLVRELAVAR